MSKCSIYSENNCNCKRISTLLEELKYKIKFYCSGKHKCNMNIINWNGLAEENVKKLFEMLKKRIWLEIDDNRCVIETICNNSSQIDQLELNNLISIIWINTNKILIIQISDILKKPNNETTLKKYKNNSKQKKIDNNFFYFLQMIKNNVIDNKENNEIITLLENVLILLANDTNDLCHESNFIKHSKGEPIMKEEHSIAGRLTWLAKVCIDLFNILSFILWTTNSSYFDPRKGGLDLIHINEMIKLGKKAKFESLGYKRI